MPAVYSTMLGAGELTDSDPPLDFPCPDGFTMVVRDMDMFTVLGIDINEFLVSDTVTSQVFWSLIATPPPLNQTFQWRGRQVFPVGTGFTLQAAQGTWGYRVSGYLLTLP